MATTTTKSMGDLTAKDVTTVRNAFTELLTAGKYDTYLDGLAEAIIARGDVILGEEKEKKTTTPKKTTEKKTEGRLPAAPAASAKKTEGDTAPTVVVGRNYTIPGEKFNGVVVKYVEPAKRDGSGRFEVVVSEEGATYAMGKVLVVPVGKVVPTKRGPRK